MTTTIHFIGLIVVTLLSSNTTPPAPPPGAQMIVGTFGPMPGMLEHLRVIAYPQGKRVNANKDWPVNGSFVGPDGTQYDYVRLNVENVTITGPTPKFEDDRGLMPHLTCCCPAFKDGFNPDWGTPTTSPRSKHSAFVTFTNGTLTTYPDPPEKDRGITTVLSLDDSTTPPANITFTGKQTGSAAKKLVIEPGTYIVVANAPKCVLEGGGTKCPVAIPQSNDFLSYYWMALKPNDCQAMPGNLNTPMCAPRPAGCETTLPASTQIKRRKLSQAILQKLHMFFVDINCSDTGWP